MEGQDSELKLRKLLLIIILMLPIVYALEECQPITEPKDIPCLITSTWNYSGECGGDNATFYNSSGGNIGTYTFDNYGSSGLCNITFNITTTGSYTYKVTNGDSGNILVEAEDNMTSLGVIIFLILLNIVLFALPLFIKFTDNEVTNNIVKKVIWLTSLAILAFNMTILASLAENAGLGITHELFVFQWFFVKGLYVGMILLFWSIFTSTPKLWKVQKDRKRMGESEE